ncbi:YwiC-like family protein [Actinomycetaceae bacterium TAE3-ERU4]|nr:YwiC-like family protein [Actinomycetaceae bacterium TAE3-ERU4]
MKKKRKFSLVRDGWIPDQHGAWAMLAAPIILGGAQGGFVPAQILLSLAAVSGFCALHTLTLWWKSRLRPRYKNPFFTHLSIFAISALALIIWHPQIFLWACFAPLSLPVFWKLYRRDERSIFSRAPIVMISCLLAPISFDLGTNFAHCLGYWPWANPTLGQPIPLSLQNTLHSQTGLHLWGWNLLWVNTAVLLLYFLATVPYVKTLIRERNSTPWLVGSIFFHQFAWSLVCWGYFTGYLTGLTLAIWTFVGLRAIALPAYSHLKNRRLSPGVIGMLEILTVTLMVFSLLWT